MKLKRLTLILLSIIMIITFSACSGGTENIIKKFTVGEWEDNTYTNDKFDLTITLPEQWYVLDAEELEGIFGDMSELLEDTELELKDGELVPLFFVMSNEDITMATSSINVTAMRSLLKPNFKAEYENESLDELIAPLEQYGEVEFEVVGETKLGSEEAFLVTLSTTITGANITQHQKMYQVYKSGYVLTFAFTSLNETELNEVVEFVSFK